MPTKRTSTEHFLKQQYAAENTVAGLTGGLEHAADPSIGPAYAEGPLPAASDLSGLVNGRDSQARKE